MAETQYANIKCVVLHAIQTRTECASGLFAVDQVSALLREIKTPHKPWSPSAALSSFGRQCHHGEGHGLPAYSITSTAWERLVAAAQLPNTKWL